MYMYAWIVDPLYGRKRPQGACMVMYMHNHILDFIARNEFYMDIHM